MKYISLIALIGLIITTLTSCSNPVESTAKAKSFGKDSFEKLVKTWDVSSVSTHLDQRLKPEDVQSVLSLCKEALGEVNSITSNKTEQIKFGVGNEAEVSGLFGYDLECEKDKATGRIGVYKHDNKWYIASFNIDSKALREYDKENVAAAHEEAKKIVEKICTDWDSEYIESIESKAFKDVAKGMAGELGIKGILAAEKMNLGKFQKIIKAQAAGFKMREGEKAYPSAIYVQCEKKNAQVIIELQKENGEWKINGFNINTGK